MKKMLDDFKAKHPQYADKIIWAWKPSLEEFEIAGDVCAEGYVLIDSVYAGNGVLLLGQTRNVWIADPSTRAVFLRMLGICGGEVYNIVPDFTRRLTQSSEASGE